MLLFSSGKSLDVYKQCTRNKKIYLLGDSTTRHWFQHFFMKRFDCVIITENWHKEKWHKPATCYSKKTNMTVGWFPHSQPFSVMGDENSYTTFSIARRLDNIGSREQALVVIGMFLHVVPYHHNVYKMKMTIIRASVEALLARNPTIQILIKGPHSYVDTPSGNLRLNDWFGYVFTNILYDVFKGLHDRVIFLNNMDTTDAMRTRWNHPPPTMVETMGEQMLAYVC